MWLCGSITLGVCASVLCGEVCWTAVQHTSPHRMPRTHTKCYAATSLQLTFTIFKKLLNTVALKRTGELPEDDLNYDRNMLEHF